MSSIVIAGDSSGSVTLQAPAVAGSTVLNLPSTSGTIQTSGAGYTTNGVAYATSTSALATGSALTFDGTNLGVGTSSPAGKLDVAGDMYVNNLPSSPTGGIYLGQSGYRASILWNVSTGNLDITPRSGFNTVFTAGNLLVGTTSATSGGSTCKEVVYISNFGTTYGISVQGGTNNAGTFFQTVNFAGTQNGSITQVNSGTIAYNTTSDYRLKENIAPMTGALAKVAQLKPVTYTWKLDGASGEGFIAHELKAVIPDSVTGEKDAVNEDGSIKPQSIDTSFLVATLTAALQEAHGLIKSLEARVVALEAK